jgi:hypothetical protein
MQRAFVPSLFCRSCRPDTIVRGRALHKNVGSTGNRSLTQRETRHRQGEPRFVHCINAQAKNSDTDGTHVWHHRPSQTILRSRQRMHASFRYLANPGNRRDLSADCRTLFAVGRIGKGEGIKTDWSRIASRCFLIGATCSPARVWQGDTPWQAPQARQQRVCRRRRLGHGRQLGSCRRDAERLRVIAGSMGRVPNGQLCGAGTKPIVSRLGPSTSFDVSGSAVSPNEAVAFYRLSAAHCIEIARHISDPDNKKSLLVMAQAWLALADHTEKYRKIALVDEAPSLRPEE